MIKTIEITNFQSHSNTILELSSGVNVIKGRSHSGKSSIVRALKWALLNTPRGDHFVSHFRDKKDETSVGIEFDDGLYVIRKRNTKVNGYELPGNNLEAIRTDLPEEVAAISHIDTINFQTQDEQYYMLKETSGKVAKELNSLVGLDIIDETISKLNKIENENTARLSILTSDDAKVKEGLKELDFVDDLEGRVVGIETLWTKYQNLTKTRNDLSRLAEEIRTDQAVIDETKEWLSIKKPVAEINELIKRHSSLLKALNDLKRVYDDITKSEVVRQRAGELVGELIKKRDTILNSVEYKKEFCPKCGAHMSNWRK